ncbi:MAG TPA: glycosyltransferase family 9 protein [Planctomycetota bacterium]|nr:glycosyltransferase family 9 protein [Planctomycetota bacterium]
MSLHSRLLDACKSVDAALGVPAARLLAGARRPLPAAPRDVLVIRLWGLGNLALMAPSLRAAAARGRVRLLTLERNAEFVRRHLPCVEPLAVREPQHPACLPSLVRRMHGLRREPPAVILDAEQFLRLPLLLARAASGAPAVGLDTPGQARGPLLDRAVRHDPTRHVADTFLALAHAAGLPPPAAGPALRVDATAAAEVATRLRAALPDAGPLVVLHPGSGDHFPGRRWPPERFAALGRALSAMHGARLVVTGVDAERELVRHVLRGAPADALDLCGRLDAAGLLALLAHADLLVANDTGPVHLADAVGTPCVALYGPNTPHRYGPRLAGARALFADLPCSPCLDDRTMKRSRCRHHVCMTALGVPDALAACRLALAAAAARRREAHAVAP